MVIYRSTTKYRFLSTIGIFNGVFLIVFAMLTLLIGEFWIFVCFFLPGTILLYLLFMVFPDEVVVDESALLFKTKLRSVLIPYIEIKEFVLHYTTRTLVMSGGDRDKAVMFYSIKIKDKPMSILLFGAGMNNYRELYDQLAEKSGAPTRSGREIWRS